MEREEVLEIKKAAARLMMKGARAIGLSATDTSMFMVAAAPVLFGDDEHEVVDRLFHEVLEELLESRGKHENTNSPRN